jgi:hypothetical protein
MYSIKIEGEEEFGRADALDKLWTATLNAALTKDMRLIKVKAQFREVTKTQVAEFQVCVVVGRL